MGFWEKVKNGLKETFAAPLRKDPEMSEMDRIIEEERKRAEEEKKMKLRNKLIEAGMTEEEIDAYDPAGAASVPSSGKLKVMVVSDTHGHLENLKKALDAERPINMLIHCGDTEDDENAIRVMAGCHCRFVSGNMDFGTASPSRDVFNIGSHRFYLCHGHRENVYSGTSMLAHIAEAEGAEAAFYGHTHVPDISEFDGIKLVNPGSIAKPRQSDRKFTYIIMELDADSADSPVFTLKDVPDGVTAKIRW